MAKKNSKRIEYFILKGELVFNGTFNAESTTKYDRNSKIRFSLKNPEFKEEDEFSKLCDCYAAANPIFIPKFVGEGIGDYFNFKTSYSVPVKDAAGNQMDDDEINSHATAYVSFKVVIDGNSTSLYPTEVKILKNGEKRESALASANW